MNENIFTRVKAYLRSKDYTFNESWLRECVQYCAETHPKLSVEGIQSFAVEQWLLSNLREINNENGCLPKNLAQQKCTTLNGSYILQMEKMYDISTSKYKQLEKIRNVNVENLKATKDVKSDFWEPKGKRMLQLFLTDGVQEIQAIEYKPIELFNETLLPGYKLKISGPIICRRGIIMLVKKNISGLGGEIEDLLILNSLENILARSLNFKENPDPYNDIKQKEESEKSDLEDEYLNDLEKLARSQDSKECEKTNCILNNYSILNLQLGYKLNLEKTSTKPNTDEFFSDDELELEALLNDPDIVDELPPIQSIQKATENVKKVDKASFFKVPSQPSSRMTHKIKVNSENPNPIVSRSVLNQTPDDSSNLESSDDNLILEDEDLIILEPCAIQVSKLSNKDLSLEIQKTLTENNSESKNSDKSPFSKSSSLKIGKSMDADVDLEIKKVETEHKKGWEIISNKVSIVKSNVIERPKSLKAKKPFNENILEQKNSFGPTNKPFTPLFPKPSSVATDQLDVDCEMKTMENKPKKGSRLFFNETTNSFGMDLEIKDTPNEFIKKLEITNADLELRLKKLLNKHNNNYLQSNEASISKLSLTQPGNSYDPQKSSSKTASIGSPSKLQTEKESKEIPIGSKRPASPVLSLNTIQPKMYCTSDSIKISEAKEKMAPRNEEPPSKICDFICDLIKEPLPDEAILKMVRAKIKEKGKLSSKGGLWHLDGLISDGTANLKVAFSSKFMDSILGFTAFDFAMMKKRVKIEPKLKEQIIRNMRLGQYKLEQLEWLMQLELIKNKTPLVIQASELTEEQKEVFEKRLQFLKPQCA